MLQENDSSNDFYRTIKHHCCIVQCILYLLFFIPLMSLFDLNSLVRISAHRRKIYGEGGLLVCTLFAL